MTRAHVMVVVGFVLLGFLALDVVVSDAPNPYTAPPMIALGSGLAATGAHCAAPPPPQ